MKHNKDEIKKMGNGNCSLIINKARDTMESKKIWIIYYEVLC